MPIDICPCSLKIAGSGLYLRLSLFRFSIPFQSATLMTIVRAGAARRRAVDV
jgi:hypothetical protein